MKRGLVLAASAFVLTACVGTPRASERVALIDPAMGAALTRPCSRPGPESAERFFVPSPSQITATETATMRLLRERAGDYAGSFVEAADEPTPFDWPVNPALYRRQYVGYYENGRPMIYGDFIPATARADLSKPVQMCDGGFRFFGVEYDLDSRSIRRIAFDGSLGGPVLAPIEP
ncbi:hypothetical protein [Citromicrobium bathyomarinum]|uniref:hypothetical protein n=1 Tax=Citromicrobium bathyomarinum TaxID=72174 RepID=UPI00315B00E8